MSLKEKYNSLLEWDKIEFIQKLEFKDFFEKWSLFNDIILDENDFDLARIEVFKILEISDIPTDYKEIFAKSLEVIVLKSLDEEVREYAVSCTSNFVQFPLIQKLISEILFNTNEDINIRYNALEAVKRIENTKEKEGIFTQLTIDNDFNNTALRLLSEL